MTWDTDSWRRAVAFATAAHADQTRKYSGRPYIEHPLAVARLVGRFTHDDAMLAAAVLHDTVEDTSATLEDIERAFSAEVADLVSDLTDVSRPDDGNRQARKSVDLLHTAHASARAKTIKLMDLTHNTISICRHDAGFAAVFLAETAQMMPVLQVASDPRAWTFASALRERVASRMERRRLERALSSH